jgi:hypothetical protein
LKNYLLLEIQLTIDYAPKDATAASLVSNNAVNVEYTFVLDSM